MPSLQGKSCVVTGAAHGIGRAIADSFLAQGAEVLATDKDDAPGRAMAGEVGCRFLRLDVAEEATARLVRVAICTKVRVRSGRQSQARRSAGPSDRGRQEADATIDWVGWKSDASARLPHRVDVIIAAFITFCAPDVHSSLLKKVSIDLFA